jgi:hypothetical protein
VRDHPARDDPRALEVDVEHRVPRLLGELVRQAVAADARVVEEDVDAAEALDRGVDGSRNLSVVADVGHRREALAAGRRALPHQRLELVRRAHGIARVLERTGHVERHHVVALASQRHSGDPALPVRRASDERDRPLRHAGGSR